MKVKGRIKISFLLIFLFYFLTVSNFFGSAFHVICNVGSKETNVFNKNKKMLKRSIVVSGLWLLDLVVCVSINSVCILLGKCPCVFFCACVLSDERGFWAVCTYCHFFPMSCLFKDIAADFESQSNKQTQKNPAVLLSVFSFNFVYIHTHFFSLSLFHSPSVSSCSFIGVSV